MSQLETQVNDIHAAIFGEKGLLVRVDRNTTHRRSMEKFKWIFLTVLLGSSVVSIFALIQ